jgi:hypothetical protein
MQAENAAGFGFDELDGAATAFELGLAVVVVSSSATFAPDELPHPAAHSAMAATVVPIATAVPFSPPIRLVVVICLAPSDL